ncbi:DUF6167 family protein [Nocardioides alkalitolerans]|uniref:DUF6167 family protein n=1 Tax=Nocardioides alkalitolerans TaxID=281714 RepID=UPI00040C4D55|nr:DUF6167 family protein [Nocardioides alkalitolerans]
MSRGVWFAAGAGLGVYAAVRARRVAEAFTPDGVRDRVAGLRLGARLLAEEFSAGSGEKEDELRERFGLAPHGLPELGTRTDPPAGLAVAGPRRTPTSTARDEQGTSQEGHH